MTEREPFARGGEMGKMGVLHDYDLMANAEDSSRGVVCAICYTPNTSFQWSDYSGEAMCRICGCVYQLKWGNEKQKAEGKYPYLTMLESFIPVAREYWLETKRFVCYGTMLSWQPGMTELITWMKEKHPEFVSQNDQA